MTNLADRALVDPEQHHQIDVGRVEHDGDRGRCARQPWPSTVPGFLIAEPRDRAAAATVAHHGRSQRLALDTIDHSSLAPITPPPSIGDGQRRRHRLRTTPSVLFSECSHARGGPSRRPTTPAVRRQLRRAQLHDPRGLTAANPAARAA